ncbi:CynX/NimT family MFS transporter [Pseudonocardia kunmingensis]|uniref:CP family cyanate transporter-like MFS transporter n=1 Tax=Pseudonocardia kunmingensis TaxID=630975 RepID=A0A543E0L3_9PSEU|nr:MFS transporter [Pseudonocardia kunmingensis]TQM15126.1 CP family cyanate transporter-like MFS transporter [Pseudonocardia kunmingensis]
MIRRHPAPTAAGRPDHHRTAPVALLVAGSVLIAANLRAALTVVGPVLDPIGRGLGLSASAAGLLNTLPLLAFAAFSPIAPGLARRLGRERALLVALVVLTAGIVVRSLPAAGALFTGTVMLGAAIAVGNVLLPEVIRYYFPDRVGVLTGTYVTVMGLVAALASGFAVPIAGSEPDGWRLALGCWAGLALITAALWAPHAVRQSPGFPPTGSTHPRRPVAMPWRSPLAWQVTGFMGLQSLGFYVMIAWLPSILESRGATSATAGWALFGYQFVALAASLVLPLVTRQVTDQRRVAVTAALCCLVGYLGLALAPSAALAWVAVVGLGGGACLVLALSFIGLRASDAAHTAALSGMAQSIGYLLAAFGPVLFGALHDSTTSWTPPLLGLAATAALLAVTGLGAGRPAHVQAAPRRSPRPQR